MCSIDIITGLGNGFALPKREWYFYNLVSMTKFISLNIEMPIKQP